MVDSIVASITFHCNPILFAFGSDNRLYHHDLYLIWKQQVEFVLYIINHSNESQVVGSVGIKIITGSITLEWLICLTLNVCLMSPKASFWAKMTSFALADKMILFYF